MSNEIVPKPVTEQERWIAHHRVDSIRIEYRQTGDDTADTYVHLTAGKEKVCWLDSTFKKVADVVLGYSTIAQPKYGVRERVKAREDYEKKNQAELEMYRALKAKYEGTSQ